MAAEYNQYSLWFEDGSLNGAKMGFYTAETTLLGIAPLSAAIEAAAEAGMVRRNLGLVEAIPEDAPAVGVYDDVEDKAILIFQDEKGKAHKWALPSPKATIFTADNETVDRTDALIVAIITQILALVTTIAGDAIVEFVRGYRERYRSQKRKPGVV